MLIKLNDKYNYKNKIVTPFLIENDIAYCYDKKHNTITIPIDELSQFKNTSKKIITPMPVSIPTTPSSPIAPNKPKVFNEPMGSQGDNKKEKIYKEEGSIKISIKGKSLSSYEVKKEKEEDPFESDNYERQTFTRPTLDDEYI